MNVSTIVNATESRYCLFVKILDDAECEDIGEYFTLRADVTYRGVIRSYVTEIVIDDTDCGKCV